MSSVELLIECIVIDLNRFIELINVMKFSLKLQSLIQKDELLSVIGKYSTL